MEKMVKKLFEKMAKDQPNRRRVLENGYELKTTFWEDFSVAEVFGLHAIQDTYDRVFDEWKTNTVYVTELCMVLNWKLFQWYGKDKDMYFLYTNLYYTVDDWCCRNLKDDDLVYYLKTTD